VKEEALAPCGLLGHRKQKRNFGMRDIDSLKILTNNFGAY
jgi:hypothetical protein